MSEILDVVVAAHTLSPLLSHILLSSSKIPLLHTSHQPGFSLLERRFAPIRNVFLRLTENLGGGRDEGLALGT